MKKIFLFAASAILTGTLFLSSCSKTDDPAVTPTSSDPRDKFVANWYVSENSHDFGSSTYNVAISDSTNSSYILFGYLYGYNRKTYATVNGNNFSIPSQIIQGQTILGSGVLSNASRIDMTYLVRTTSSHYDTIRAVLTK